MPATAIERAFDRLYNFDFPGVWRTLDELERREPGYPLTYSVRAAARLFSELDRMKILETEFFSKDDNVTEIKLKADPAVRQALFEATGMARKLSSARLAANPNDHDAMLAMCMASGVESDYTVLVEKRYLKSFSLSRESQMYAHKLLALNPPDYDAYLTLGSVEYVVGSMNFFFRLFVHFDQIRGSKAAGIENLERVVTGGHYYPPFAKMLLSVIHLRDSHPEKAVPLLEDLAQSYPQNPLLAREAARARKLAAAARAKHKR